MRRDGSVGDVVMTATFNATRDAAEGSALVSGPCVAQPTTAVLKLSKQP